MKLLDLHKQKAFAPLHHKDDLFKGFLTTWVLPSTNNNYEKHNKPSQFWKLYQHIH
jgi:hypothetical protein